ncbi:MAG: YdjY domain-containing protein [Planctomycetes bacterium]|nr:YdjY domain-containing protein [Planctomycetota bacterium]
MLLRIFLAAALAAFTSAPAPVQDREGDLTKLFEAQGITLDRAGGVVSIPMDVCVRDALLEYLLVGPNGAAHESLFTTPVAPSLFNTALILLGAEPGKNASWRPKDPRPSDEELLNGVSPWVVEPPSGSSFFLYVGWRQAGETYFYRMEDLLRDLSRGHGMQRHAWVYLGSKMIPAGERDKPDEEAFAADLYGNVINISFFSEGYTLLTAALPECVEQTIWMPNAWLVPERGERVKLFVSKQRIESLPPSLAATLPEVAPPKPLGR